VVSLVVSLVVGGVDEMPVAPTVDREAVVVAGAVVVASDDVGPEELSREFTAPVDCWRVECDRGTPFGTAGADAGRFVSRKAPKNPASVRTASEPPAKSGFRESRRCGTPTPTTCVSASLPMFFL
jgi:hypothetical protein